MSKALAVEFELKATDLPMGGPWACSCSPSDRDPTAKAEPDLLEHMAEINCLLVDLGVYDQVYEAIESLDCTEYEDGEHMGYARVYSDGSLEINEADPREN